MQIKKIFNGTIAQKLIQKGFKVIRFEKNLKNPIFTVFVFEKTKEFEETLLSITLKK
jgi:hypothetical protein